jgi:hypothetical protein
MVAMPTFTDWSMGDGGSMTCHGPGTPYHRCETCAADIARLRVCLRRAVNGSTEWFVSGVGDHALEGDLEHDERDVRV